MPAARLDLAVPALPLFLIGGLASALLTWAWIVVARRSGIEDLPGRRRLHVQATPRGGGVAIAIVLLAFLALLLTAAAPGAPRLPWVWLAGGLAAFAALGLADDLRPLSVASKFGGQWIAAAMLVCGISLIAPGESAAVAFVVALVGAVYVANIWNFMDGSNGLVASQSLLLAAALSAWPGQASELRLLGLVLAGACLGFLPFNLPRARVFLGDAGSLVLGAAVFALGLLSWRLEVLSLPALLLLPTAMLLDSGLTLAGRASRGRRLWKAHREHLYQYAVRSGLSHATVCIAYAIWTLAMIGLAALVDTWRSSSIKWSLLISCWMLGALAYRTLRRNWLLAATHRGDHE